VSRCISVFERTALARCFLSPAADWRLELLKIRILRQPGARLWMRRSIEACYHYRAAAWWHNSAVYPVSKINASRKACVPGTARSVCWKNAAFCRCRSRCSRCRRWLLFRSKRDRTSKATDDVYYNEGGFIVRAHTCDQRLNRRFTTLQNFILNRRFRAHRAINKLRLRN